MRQKPGSLVFILLHIVAPWLWHLTASTKPQVSTHRFTHVFVSSTVQFKMQVDDKDHLLEDGRLLGTIDMLTRRLLLKKSATGAWELRMDRHLSPYLFMGM